MKKMSRSDSACSIIILVVLSFVTPSCGTRDYSYQEKESKDHQSKTKEASKDEKDRTFPNMNLKDQEFLKNRTREKNQSLYARENEQSSGWTWEAMEFVGVNPQTVDAIHESLADTSQESTFEAIGATAVLGAIIGIIVKASGSSAFGGPVNSEASHAVWNRLDRMRKSGGRSAFNGATFNLGCFVLFRGLHPLALEGLFGHAHSALSAATALAFSASIAASANTARVTRALLARKSFKKFTGASELKKDTILKITNTLFVVGVGSGVGYLVYQGLQH